MMFYTQILQGERRATMIEILEMTVFGSSKRISFIFLKVGLRDLAGGGAVLDKKNPEVIKGIL